MIHRPKTVGHYTIHWILTCKAGRTLAGVAGDGVSADASVAAGAADTVVDVGLAAGAREADGTRTLERVDQVVADATVQARVDLALVYVDLTLRAREPWNNMHQSQPEKGRWTKTINLVASQYRM